MPKGIWISINNYKNYRARKEIKFPQWFSCSNRILEDPDFYNFSFAEICAWVWLLSTASLKKSGTIFVNFEEAHRKARLTPKTMRSALNKLSGAQIEILDHRPCEEETHESATACIATGEGKTGEDKGGDSKEPEPDGSLSPKELFELWNENRKSLSRVEKLTDTRKKKCFARLKDHPEIEFWEGAIQKAVAIFDEVPKDEWRFGFDDLIHDEKLTKLLEGKYDFLRTKHTKRKQTFADMKSAGNADLMRRAQEGEFSEYEN